MKKSIGIIVFLVILSVVWVAVRMYNKPHRDPLSESHIQINSSELFRTYESNETEANKLYLDRVLKVSGKISEITTNQEQKPIFVLESENPLFGIRCTMESSDANTKVGDDVFIKGICAGYLSDVIIIKATLVE